MDCTKGDVARWHASGGSGGQEGGAEAARAQALRLLEADPHAEALLAEDLHHHPALAVQLLPGGARQTCRRGVCAGASHESVSKPCAQDCSRLFLSCTLCTSACSRWFILHSNVLYAVPAIHVVYFCRCRPLPQYREWRCRERHAGKRRWNCGARATGVVSTPAQSIPSAPSGPRRSLAAGPWICTVVPTTSVPHDGPGTTSSGAARHASSPAGALPTLEVRATPGSLQTTESS